MNTISPSRKPSEWRNHHRFSMSRLFHWTIPRRYHEMMAKITQISLIPPFEKSGAKVDKEYGERLEHTSVTTKQLKVLIGALQHTESMPHPIIEIGSFRGITTRGMASATKREVIAVDPYLGDGGHPKDLPYFETHTAGLSNVRMIRAASDPAFDSWGGEPVSLVFIDAIHEYVHAWYDFSAWGSLVPVGGMVAFHDVDLFPGVNRVCQKILREHPEWKPWGYAPNIAIFQRI